MQVKMKKIILHCSDSRYGDAHLLDQWHKARGFIRIGYHYVILNGFRTWRAYQARQLDCGDGALEIGRNEVDVGAHCAGHNAHSIGVCLIGRGEYTPRQLETARRLMVVDLLKRYPQALLLGHYELNPQKECPMLDMKKIRREWLGVE